MTLNIKQFFLKYFINILFLFIFVWLPFSLESGIEQFIPVVVSRIPHSLPAFTQGLAIEDDVLYESTGLYGHSDIRRIDAATGKILQRISLSPQIFAEGIALLPNHIMQITWKENKALIYDRNNLKVLSTLFYSGEGWGLCREGSTVWMSNGSSQIIQRHSTTFQPINILQVNLKGKKLKLINDLECVGDFIYANVWGKDWIVRIDKMTGEVNGLINASFLLTQKEKKALKDEDVLNGIAFRSKTNTFFITGKNWPWIFEVAFKKV